MIRFLLPSLSGTLRFDRPLPEDVLTLLEQRIEAGALFPGSRRRSQYVVTGRERTCIRFRAVNWLTAISIGLNQVTIVREDPQELQYTITFWRWTGYAAALCAAIAGALLLVYGLSGSMREQVRSEGKWIFFAMVFFWGFCWPWLLTALHKRNLPRALKVIVEGLRDPEKATPAR